MISEVPTHPRCIVKIMDNSGPPAVAPKGFSYYRQPRHILVNGQQPSPLSHSSTLGNGYHQQQSNTNSHHRQFNHQSSPPSPPLPPPPPPPPMNLSPSQSLVRPSSIQKSLFTDAARHRIGNTFLPQVSESTLPRQERNDQRSNNRNDQRCERHESRPEPRSERPESNFVHHQNQLRRQETIVKEENVPEVQVRRSLSITKHEPTFPVGILEKTCHKLSLPPEMINQSKGFTETIKIVDRINHNIGQGPSPKQSKSETMTKLEANLVIRKPGNLFLSQLYFIFHLALVVCILRANDATKRNKSSKFHESVLYFFAYLMATSIMFICSIRCCKTDGGMKRRSTAKNTCVLFGAMTLGLVQLVAIGLDFAQCVHKHFIFFPILQFSFTFLSMHFILTQARNGQPMGFSNLAIGHLLVTQTALWMANFDSNYGPCGYSVSILGVNASRVTGENGIESDPVYPFSGLLVPIIHHFQLLSIFILLSLWVMNNDLKSLFLTSASTSPSNSTDSSFGYHFFEKKSSIKGFFLGLLMVASSIVVLVLQDTFLSLITHTSLQGVSAIASLVGIVFLSRDKLKAIHPTYGNFGKDHQLIIFVTILATYYCSICMIIGNLISRSATNYTAIADGLCMIFHSSFQTILLKGGQQRCNRMREVYALLILANASIWMLEVTQVSAKLMQLNSMDILLLPAILMSLNRFYSALVFIDFWRGK